MKKTIKTVEYAAIEFTDEEIEALGLKKDWNYSITEDGGKIIMTPYASVEIDFGEYSKKELVYIIEKSVKNDQTISETIENILREVISENELTKNREF